MAGANQIGQLLDQLRSDADFDSSGQFTTDYHRAIEKIALMAREQPSRWLLFGVQAAVAWNAPQVQLSFDHQASSLSFPLAQGDLLWNNPHLLTGLGSPTDSACKLWNACLLWARATGEKVSVLLRTPRGGWLVELEGDKTLRAAQSATQESTLSLLLSSSERSPMRTAELSQQVARRLSFCPTPVIQEGRTLNSGFFPHLESLHGLLARWVLAAEPSRSRLAAIHPSLVPALQYYAGIHSFRRDRDWAPTPSMPVLEIEGPNLEQASLSRSPQPASVNGGHLLVGGWTQNDGAHSLTLSLQRPYRPLYLPPEWCDRLLECRALFHRTRDLASRLWIVQDGCSLNPIELSGPEGWSVALASQSLKTDLSGWCLVQDDNLRQQQDWVEQQIMAIHYRQNQLQARAF